MKSTTSVFGKSESSHWTSNALCNFSFLPAFLQCHTIHSISFSISVVYLFAPLKHRQQHESNSHTTAERGYCTQECVWPSIKNWVIFLRGRCWNFNNIINWLALCRQHRLTMFNMREIKFKCNCRLCKMRLNLCWFYYTCKDLKLTLEL